MRRPRRTALVCALLVALGLHTSAARAYDFEIAARTEAYGYQLRRYDRQGLTFLNRRRITQYLRLRIFNLLDDGRLAQILKGDDKRAPALLYLHTTMRFAGGFGGYTKPLVEWPELRNNRFELLTAALEGRNLFGFLDFTLGRQYDAELMDFFGYDGLRVRLNTPWKIFIEGHIGLQVDRAQPFSAVFFETDGVSGDAADESPAPTFGVAVGIANMRHLDLRVAYRGTASAADIVIGPDGTLQRLWGVDQELFFVSAAARLPLTGTMLLFGARYNLLLASFDDVQVSAMQRIGDAQQITVEAGSVRPNFRGDSIFNVFAIEPYSELAGRYSLRLDALRVRFDARVGYRWFASTQDGEAAADPGALSLSLIGQYTGVRLLGGLALFYFEGQHGRRGGGDASARYRLRSWIAFEGRASLVTSRDEAQGEGRSVTTFGVQLGTRVRFLPQVLLHILFEDNISRLYKSATRLFAVLDFKVSP
ncbi:MAG: hypothetical protein KC503_21125 [Myxococcales bacterium]|nr:hypothetical protein [Myxococcales bacterium]